MKKAFKKMIALVAVLVLTLAMAVPAFADTTDATLKITGLKAGDKVDLYQIGTANADGSITFVSGANFADETKPTSQEILTIAAKLQKSPAEITATKVKDNQQVADTEFTYTTSAAGVFIAIIHSGSGNDKIYNPVLLAANLKPNGLQGGSVSVTETYKYGNEAVAKSSTPTVTKTQETTKPDTKDGQPIDTGSVGERVKYTVTPTLPGYPVNAVNKTMYVSDTMTAGLTFEFDTLSIRLDGDTRDLTRSVTAGIASYTNAAGDVIATAKEVGNGFNLSFDYDKLNGKQPTVKYSAIINDNAVIGNGGNKNHVEYFYASNPSGGSTYDELNAKPQEGENIKKKEDTKTVYTYEIKFTKVDNNAPESEKYLAGAVFGLYEDSGCTKLIDTIVTNKKGIGASAKVGAGTYYLKELVAPAGYSLSSTPIPVTANWTSATTTTSKSTVRASYTSKIPAAPNDVQVGWLKNNKYYAMSAFTQEEVNTSAGAIVPAYLSEYTSTLDTTEFTTTPTAGSGVVSVAEGISNTKLGELPSTGSVGTYIFTIIGVAVLAAAAYLIINGKRVRK